MKRKFLYPAIAIAVGLSGCAGTGAKGGVDMAAKACEKNKCKLDVTITSCTAPGGISVEPKELLVLETSKIEWTIKTRGYKFPGNGIVIGEDPKKEFDTPSPDLHDSKKFTVGNKHKQNGYFPDYWTYYAINVVNDDGTRCGALDPWIRNR